MTDLTNDETERLLIDRLMAYVLATEPTAGPPVSEECLRRMITTGVGRARSHGFRQETNLARFIAIMFQIAPNFDDHPAFKAILDSDDPSVPEEERLIDMARRVPPAAYREAACSYDLGAWFAIHTREGFSQSHVSHVSHGSQIHSEQ